MVRTPSSNFSVNDPECFSASKALRNSCDLFPSRVSFFTTFFIRRVSVSRSTAEVKVLLPTDEKFSTSSSIWFCATEVATIATSMHNIDISRFIFSVQEFFDAGEFVGIGDIIHEFLLDVGSRRLCRRDMLDVAGIGQRALDM